MSVYDRESIKIQLSREGDSNQKVMLIVESTVPREMNIPERHEYKLNK